MIRWKVAQHIERRFWLAYPAFYDSEEPASNIDDDRPRKALARGFRTWKEAIDYADRMTRTCEVELPRITADMEDGLCDWPNLRDVRLYVSQRDEPRLGQPYVEITDEYQRIEVDKHEFRPLGLILLTLAKMADAWDEQVDTV